MMQINRRQFLLASAGLLATPVWSRVSVPTNPDVVIIGAGAAGMAVARTLLEQGRSFVVIEAADRIGGRLHTDTSIFGVPFDIGAHWLHQKNANPFVQYGKENGFTLYSAPDDEILYVADREATEDEYEDFESAMDEMSSAIATAGRGRKDVSPMSVMPDLGEWQGTVHLLTGPFEMAKDFDHFSCVDWYNSADGEDWYCKEGFGALWAHSAQGVPVQLNTKAKAINWNGEGVAVETDQGAINAKSCIVTVSTGVLAHGEIKFNPPLPIEKQESFQNISMGVYNHVGLQFRQNFFGIGDDGYLVYKVDSKGQTSPNGFALLTNVSGTNLSYADLGGEFAQELEKEGDQAQIDFVLSELRRIFGGEVDKQLIKASVACWGENPLFYGSYASAEPGAYHYREVLRQPVAGKIWFAGEACSRTQWATVAGAHKSGIQVAKQVAEYLEV